MQTQTEWMGGKPVGYLTLNRKYITVVFPQSTQREQKKFIISKNNDAWSSANEYQMNISNQLGLTKNKYRYITEVDGSNYLEVQLQRDDLVMKCEVEHLPQVEDRIWTGNKSAHNNSNYYVQSKYSIIREQEYSIFHTLVYPELTDIEHINKDGLDNRKSNIRDRSDRIIPPKKINKNNTTGQTGVHLENADNAVKARYKTQWTDLTGKKCTKSFSCAKWGKDIALLKACEWRTENHNGK